MQINDSESEMSIILDQYIKEQDREGQLKKTCPKHVFKCSVEKYQTAI